MKILYNNVLTRVLTSVSIVFLCLALLVPGWAFGQAPGVLTLEQAQRFRTERLEREARAALEYRMKPSQRFLFDYGGWYRLTYLNYDDLDNSLLHQRTRILRLHDLRLWAMLNLDNTHTFYVRERTSLYDWDHNDNYRRYDTDYNVELDQAFYSLQIDGALKRYLGVRLPLGLQFTGGQFFSQIGTGLVYSRVAQGVELNGQSRFVNFKTFWSKTPQGESNIDYSVPGFRTRGQDRYFYGVELTYPRFSHHEPYFFWMQQEDHSDPVPPDPTQKKFDYDSQYIGLGSRGEIIKNLTYEVEGIRETGRSYGDNVNFGGSQSPNDISAWAFTTKLTKIFDVLTRPRLSFQYAMGTGAKDRQNPTNTIGGNAPGKTDRNFLYFGYMDTGYMLSPRLSNLQMLHLGGSLKPLDFNKDLKDNLEIGLNYYLYKKDKAEAGISDFRANRPLGSLGKELDAYVNWKAVSDVFVNFNWGRFYPSNAFGDRDIRDYFLMSLTYQF